MEKKLKDCRFQWVEEILKIWYGKEICHRGWSYKRVKFKIEIVKEMQFRAVCVLRGVEIKIIRSGGQETAWILKSPRIIRAVELEKKSSRVGENVSDYLTYVMEIMLYFN